MKYPLTLTLDERQRLVSQTPGGVADHYIRMIINTFQQLFGVQMDSSIGRYPSCKSTVPLSIDTKGVSGLATKFCNTNENQDRDSLHGHALLWFAWNMGVLNTIATYPGLVKEFTNALDKMVMTWLPPAVLAYNLLSRKKPPPAII